MTLIFMHLKRRYKSTQDEHVYKISKQFDIISIFVFGFIEFLPWKFHKAHDLIKKVQLYKCDP